MNVVFLSPGFPKEMPYFVAGLAEIGVRVIGVSEQPEALLPGTVRRALSEYVQVDSLWDEAGLIETLRRLAARTSIDRVECLWEPGVTLAAAIREALDLPGMRRAQALLFRDKEKMKQALDAAGIRTPRHARAADDRAARDAAERIGFPLIVKPIAGAGSADTHRADDARELDQVLARVAHVKELSVEEYIDGEEYTFDTICSGGSILYRNVSWYRPRPLIARSLEWISPQTVALRNFDRLEIAPGLEMGRRVLRALGFDSGFTHMEWFLTSAGEAVFGEIAARPPGALSVDIMNYASDIDTFVGWAEAVCHGRFTQIRERRYNSAVIFKRAQGAGRVREIHGLERLVARFRPHIVSVDLLPPGSPRRNWRATLLSDGHVIVRHPDLSATLEMADRFGTDLRIVAG